jgi:heme-degrading monooxygenase HmoA
MIRVIAQKDKDIMTRDQGVSGWPARYYAVIFTAQRSLSGDDIYEITADRMVQLAQQQSGFLGIEAVRGDDGIGITVSYWRSRQDIANWRRNAEHMAAQALGRQEFYDWFRIRIAEVVKDYGFLSEQVVARSKGA